MRILITGGTGTISRSIALAAIQNNDEVYAITRGKHSWRNVDGVKYINCNLRDKDDVKAKMPKFYFDVVVETQVYSVNQLKKSLELFGGAKQYVFISTAGVYNRDVLPIHEEDRKSKCSWMYVQQKLACEKYLNRWKKKTMANVTIIRPSVVWGNYRIPYPIATRKNGYTLVQRILDNRPILANQWNDVVFSTIYETDFASNVYKCFMNTKAYGQTIHIGSPQSVLKWDDIVYEMARILKCDITIYHVPCVVMKTTFSHLFEEIYFDKSSSSILSDDKSKSICGDFQIKTELRTGLEAAIENLKNEHEQYIKEFDMQFWDCCDDTIYYSYKKNLLSSRENAQFEKYLENLEFSERQILEKRFRKIIKQRPLILGKYYIKRIIKCLICFILGKMYR